MSSADSAALARLLERLDLESVGPDRYRGLLGAGRGRVFGGMVAAQALVAAGRTIDHGCAHSIHVHFLRPGRHRIPVDWSVTRLRDGRALSVRSVVGMQQDQVIATMTASFASVHDGLEHQDPMPVVPPPDELPDSDDLKATIFGRVATSEVAGPLELRECDPATALPAVGTPARRALWIRPRGTLPDVPLLHTAVLIFASDRAVLSTAGRPHGLVWTPLVGASLDHTVWLHHPAHLDGWLLVANHSPVAAGGRALVFGAIYRPDGTRIASVAQEGMIRNVAERSSARREP